MHLRSLRQLFYRNGTWAIYLSKHISEIRDVVIDNVTRMMACGSASMGSRLYKCKNTGCTYTKYLNQSCKSRACSSCGVKSTERWIRQQQHVLPDCEWQHITFTMPSTLWPTFRHNRWLLNRLFKCAADILTTWAKRQGLEIGVFCALHTYGRKLNWNCHVHASATRGGICQRTGLWKPIYFKAKVTEACWRAAVTQLLRAHYSELDLSLDDCPFIRHEEDWFAFLRSQYRRRWKLHFGKKTDQQHKTVNYLGRYLKRPPISGSRLHHYSKGGQLTFEYLNHRTGEKETLTLATEELICRLIEHIPDKHFKMIRYYGFLSNRRRGEMLPKVNDALEMEDKDAPALPCYASMLKKFANVNPYECLLCKEGLEFVSFRAGESREELIRQTVLEGQLRSA
ncbi:TPA: IS91 family transposase [Vibrio parahaemolyticus]